MMMMVSTASCRRYHQHGRENPSSKFNKVVLIVLLYQLIVVCGSSSSSSTNNYNSNRNYHQQQQQFERRRDGGDDNNDDYHRQMRSRYDNGYGRKSEQGQGDQAQNQQRFDSQEQQQQPYSEHQQYNPNRSSSSPYDSYSGSRRYGYEDDNRRQQQDPPPPQQRPQYGQQQQQQQRSDRSSESQIPINYQFKSATESRRLIDKKDKIDPVSKDNTEGGEDEDIPPQTSLPVEDDNSITRQKDDYESDSNNNKIPKYASPRTDIITRYMSNKRKRVLLTISCGMVGLCIGGFIGKSLFGKPMPIAISFMILMITCTFLRNPYGELSKALGLALLLALQRTKSIRKQYPAMKHFKSCIGLSPRQVFPPGLEDNPWTYQPPPPVDIDHEDDDTEANVEFKMLYTFIAMAFIGSVSGGNIHVPLLPTWIGALCGAGLLAFATTLNNPKGDLARVMGMRVVALASESIHINNELHILQKSAVVSGRVLDKVLILDRKHRIKDRLVSMFSWIYDQITSTAQQVQQSQQQSDNRQQQQRGGGGEGGRGGRIDEQGPRRTTTTNRNNEEQQQRRASYTGNDDAGKRRW